MRTRYPKDHPIWKIITHGMYGVLITGCLYFNANNFDSTEIKTIIEVFVVMAGVETVKKRFEGKDDEE